MSTQLPIGTLRERENLVTNADNQVELIVMKNSKVRQLSLPIYSQFYRRRDLGSMLLRERSLRKHSPVSHLLKVA